MESMERWEYSEVRVHGYEEQVIVWDPRSSTTTDAASLGEALNMLGRGGWELVCGAGHPSAIVYTLKRRLA